MKQPKIFLCFLLISILSTINSPLYGMFGKKVAVKGKIITPPPSSHSSTSSAPSVTSVFGQKIAVKKKNIELTLENAKSSSGTSSPLSSSPVSPNTDSSITPSSTTTPTISTSLPTTPPPPPPPSSKHPSSSSSPLPTVTPSPSIPTTSIAKKPFSTLTSITTTIQSVPNSITTLPTQPPHIIQKGALKPTAKFPSHSTTIQHPHVSTPSVESRTGVHNTLIGSPTEQTQQITQPITQGNTQSDESGMNAPEITINPPSHASLSTKVHDSINFLKDTLASNNPTSCLKKLNAAKNFKKICKHSLKIQPHFITLQKVFDQLNEEDKQIFNTACTKHKEAIKNREEVISRVLSGQNIETIPQLSNVNQANMEYIEKLLPFFQLKDEEDTLTPLGNLLRYKYDKAKTLFCDDLKLMTETYHNGFKNPVIIMIAGKSRAGKTTLINVLNDPKYIPPLPSLYAQTVNASISTSTPIPIKNIPECENAPDLTISLIDTPGLFEIKSIENQTEQRKNKEILNNIISFFRKAGICKINQICFTFSITEGLREEDVNALTKVLPKFLGFEITDTKKITVEDPISFIITHAEKLNKEQMLENVRQLQMHPAISNNFPQFEHQAYFMGCISPFSEIFREQRNFETKNVMALRKYMLKVIYVKILQMEYNISAIQSPTENNTN